MFQAVLGVVCVWFCKNPSAVLSTLLRPVAPSSCRPPEGGLSRLRIGLGALAEGDVDDPEATGGTVVT